MDLYFNPRSREGSDGAVPSCLLLPGNFNPRSREGSDQVAEEVCSVYGISIHAPVKGATFISSPFGTSSIIISIHAPVKGATVYIESGNSDAVVFQSTLP